jgi:hypothetical protein
MIAPNGRPSEKVRAAFGALELIEQGTISLARNEINFNRENKVTQTCNTPLFDAEEKRTGVCKSCRSGYKEDNNYPTAKGLEQIRQVGHE